MNELERKAKNRDKNGSVVTLTRVISGFPSSQTLPHFDAMRLLRRLFSVCPEVQQGNSLTSNK